ncbi:glycerophosphodiester phosphodiesterase family protein [Pelagibius sp. CAU 1746]|uniref:glycerophosphodiester phosphodiesterase family protein n=1 Tax=Pelagibius sp. CAU 1746 TaxID=3140370 RepID=UPI00325C04E6
MGHRGAKALAPENTLASMRAAAAAGVTWVEFDVMLTGDGQPVLFHDDTLRRTTGAEGEMARTPLAVVRGLDATRHFTQKYSKAAGLRFRGQPECRVPSLEETAACLLELGLTPNVEIKPTKGLAVETAETALTRLRKLWPADRPAPLISSFERASLAAAKRVAPDWPRGLLAEEFPADWRQAMAELDCVSMHLYWRRTRRADVAAVKAAGYAFAVYTVNGVRAGRRLLDKGVDCLITDRPDLLVPALG